MPRHLRVEGKDYVFPDDGSTCYVEAFERRSNGTTYRKKYTVLPDGSGKIQVRKLPKTWRAEDLEQPVGEELEWEDAGTFPPQAPPRRRLPRWDLGSGYATPDREWSEQIKEVKEMDPSMLHAIVSRDPLLRSKGPAKQKVVHAAITEAMDEAIGGSINKEPPNMKNFPTGQRVTFPHPNEGTTQTGTIIDCHRDVPMREGTVLVCADQQDSKRYRDCNNWTGDGFGVFLRASRVHPFGDTRNADTFFDVPKQIGVTVLDDFRYDGMSFKRHHTGRLINLQDGGLGHGTMALVSWSAVRRKHFSRHCVRNPKTGNEILYQHCYSVPANYLRWCRMDENQAFRVMWPGLLCKLSSPFKEGDYVVYTSERPSKVSGERHYFAVVKGAILSVAAVRSDDNTVDVRCISGVAKGALGLLARVTPDMIAPLEFPYLEAGKRIEIAAQLEFKKKDLQGQRGVVVLPTDADGDVGIQFDEDIGAGSLDGYGKTRHCLYVPVRVTKKVSK